MSSPRDRDGFDDRADGSGWREPEHLGEGAPDAPREPGPARDAAESDRTGELPAWAVPAERSRARDDYHRYRPEEGHPAAYENQHAVTGRWGRAQPAGDVAKVFAYKGDAFGVQAWAVQHGWAISDGSLPEDAVLADLIRSAPVRAGKDHRAAGVLRGRYGTLELVAFDAVYAKGRYLVPEWAITAAPLLTPPPQFRLSPARFWKHRTGGLLQVPSGNDQFDARWVLLAAEDGPAARRLVQDPQVQGLLLGTDDGDEFWSAAGHVAAVRPDGHRPTLLEHHARLLAAVVAALTPGF